MGQEEKCTGMCSQPEVSRHLTRSRERACPDPLGVCVWWGLQGTPGTVSSTHSSSTGSGWPSNPLRPFPGHRSVFRWESVLQNLVGTQIKGKKKRKEKPNPNPTEKKNPNQKQSKAQSVWKAKGKTLTNSGPTSLCFKDFTNIQYLISVISDIQHAH